MNATTKQRYISTSIWDDDWFDSLSEREKLAYFYLLTNTHTNAAGVYQCTLKNMRLEIGLDREEVERIMGKFAAAGKAYYFKDYIIIPKWLKHQKVGERSTMMLGATSVIKSLPDDVKEFISDRGHYDYDISAIIGGKPVSQAGAEPMDSLSSEGGLNPDSLCQNNDSLSIAYQKTDIGYPQNNAKSAHDLDLDSDFDSDSNFDVDLNSDLDIASRDEKPSEKGQQQQIINFAKIKETAASLGYSLSTGQAEAFLCLEHSWLSGKYNFLVFAAENIRTDPRYVQKPHQEKERLFSKSWGYENLKEFYPAWVRGKIDAQKSQDLESKQRTPPKKCLNCGNDMDGMDQCPLCKGYNRFDFSKKTWEYIEPPDKSINFSEELYKRIGKKRDETTIADDIDF